MIKGLILGIQFLTRIPLNLDVEFNEKNIRRSCFFFPFIGLLLGFISIIPYNLLISQSRDIASIVTVSMMILLTGGLHLDGLADTADGFFSNKKREEILNIMSDSKIGAFGALSLILIILFKLVVIGSFKVGLPISLILSMGNARLVVLIQIAFKKIARPGGLGDIVHSSKPNGHVIVAGVIYTILTVLIDIQYLIPILVSLLFGEGISLYAYKKIDGFTGDVYGAVIEIVEIVSLLVFWRLFNWI